MQTCEAYEKCPAELTASSAFENTPKRSETNSETCPRMPRRIHIWRVEHPGWRTPFPDVCRREGRKTKPLRLRTQLARAARSRVCRSDDRVGRRQEHATPKEKTGKLHSVMGGSATMRSPPTLCDDERVCSGSLLALCTCRILPSNSPSHGRHKVDREAVQAREQVHVRVHAAWRESAKGTREMQQVIALAKVAAPSLERNDRVGVLVEDFL